MEKEQSQRIEAAIDSISKKLDRIAGSGNVDQILVDLNRHQVGSIGLCDAMNDEAQSEVDRREYLKEASLIWSNPVFKKEIASLIRKQENFTVCWAEDEKQILIGRGTINGLSLIEEKFRELNAEHEEVKPRKEEFDEHAVV